MSDDDITTTPAALKWVTKAAFFYGFIVGALVVAAAWLVFG